MDSTFYLRSLKQNKVKSAAIARMLIDSGINANKYNSEGHSPLHIACISEQIEAIKFMKFINEHYK